MVQDPQRIDLSLEPLDDYVVIQPTDEEAETRTGPSSIDQAADTNRRVLPVLVLLHSARPVDLKRRRS
ncbi:MAG: hypothetical protein M3Q92_07530 [Actinomycetota bacterium]|nr:hypothetical protein [Actinomycetota bacterium]